MTVHESCANEDAAHGASWASHVDEWAGADALVVGNGPSRSGQDVRVARHAGPVVLCNAAWRTVPVAAFDVVVACFDGPQVPAASDYCLERGARLLVPQQCDGDRPRLYAAVRGALDPALRRGLLLVAKPHRALVRAADLDAAPAWWPTSCAVGNFAGMLAFQLALLAGAARIGLLGIDCAGLVDATDRAPTKLQRVTQSAVSAGTPGYGAGIATVGATIPVEDAPGWRQDAGQVEAADLWRALVRVARRRGVEVYRAAPGGALTDLPVVP